VIRRFTEDAASLMIAAGARPGSPALDGQACCVCFVEEAVACLPCGHGLCEDDWPAFLKSSLDSGTVGGENCTRLKCPGAHCSLRVPPGRFERFLGAGDYKRYRGLLQLSFMNDGGTVRQCPAEGCGLYVVSRSRRPVLTCGCGHSFCLSCGQPAHVPVRCSEARKWFELTACTDTNRDADTKNCPNPDCGAPTFKVDGCHYLICSLCKEHWCWMCGQWGGGPSQRPSPHHVFECNAEISLEWTSNRDAIGLFERRYENHLSSLNIISKQGEKLIADLGGAARIKAGDAKLVQDAIKVLVDCRRALAWTYVQCYFAADRQLILRLKHGQNDFERQVEQFNSTLSADWLRCSASEHEIDDLAAAILEGRMKTLRGLLDSMMPDLVR